MDDEKSVLEKLTDTVKAAVESIAHPTDGTPMKMPLNESGYAITHLGSGPNPKRKVPRKKAAKKAASKSAKKSAKKRARNLKSVKGTKRPGLKGRPVAKSRTTRKIAKKKK